MMTAKIWLSFDDRKICWRGHSMIGGLNQWQIIFFDDDLDFFFHTCVGYKATAEVSGLKSVLHHYSMTDIGPLADGTAKHVFFGFIEFVEVLAQVVYGYMDSIVYQSYYFELFFGAQINKDALIAVPWRFPQQYGPACWPARPAQK
jgi:hypothetical protein